MHYLCSIFDCVVCGLKVLSLYKMLFWQLAFRSDTYRATSDNNVWGEVSSFQFPFAHNIPRYIPDIHFQNFSVLVLVLVLRL